MARLRSIIPAAAGILVLVALLAVPAPSASSADAREGEWLAGDLHVHTCYSHDAWCPPDDDNTGPDEFYTLSLTVEQQFLIASARGLDYLAITDHNDIRSQSDPGFEAGGVIGVHGYENSLRGHAQMLGATKIYDNGDSSVAAVQKVAEELRSDGGVFQINHPAEGSVDFPHDTDWDYLYEVVPDTVEVWNISRLWQPPMPSASSNDDAVRFWEGWLDRGHRVGATGGSDNHWASTNAVQGPGQPTTWVFAEERSERGILEGLRRGHTFITHQPPSLGGPMIFLEGDSEGDGDFEAMVGDAVSVTENSRLRVRVQGAAGSLLRIVAGGGALEGDIVVSGAEFVHEFNAPSATWVRAEIYQEDLTDERRETCDDEVGAETTYCRNHLAILAMTSAIFLGAEAPTTLSLQAPSSGHHTDAVGVTASLASDGDPLEGKTVGFALGSSVAQATTDASGIARTTLTLSDHPGSYGLTARFDGGDGYLPSQDSAPFEILKEITEISYTGDTQARGESVTLEAILTEDDGPAVPGKTVTFEVDGRIFEAATDAEGVAEVEANIPEHGRSQDVVAAFAGDGDFEGSETSSTIFWGRPPTGSEAASARWSPDLALGLLLAALLWIVARRLIRRRSG